MFRNVSTSTLRPTVPSSLIAIPRSCIRCSHAPYSSRAMYLLLEASLAPRYLSAFLNLLLPSFRDPHCNTYSSTASGDSYAAQTRVRFSGSLRTTKAAGLQMNLFYVRTQSQKLNGMILWLCAFEGSLICPASGGCVENFIQPRPVIPALHWRPKT